MTYTTTLGHTDTVQPKNKIYFGQMQQNSEIRPSACCITNQRPVFLIWTMQIFERVCLMQQPKQPNLSHSLSQIQPHEILLSPRKEDAGCMGAMVCRLYSQDFTIKVASRLHARHEKDGHRHALD